MLIHLKLKNKRIRQLKYFSLFNMHNTVMNMITGVKAERKNEQKDDNDLDWLHKEMESIQHEWVS